MQSAATYLARRRRQHQCTFRLSVHPPHSRATAPPRSKTPSTRPRQQYPNKTRHLTCNLPPLQPNDVPSADAIFPALRGQPSSLPFPLPSSPSVPSRHQNHSVPSTATPPLPTPLSASPQGTHNHHHPLPHLLTPPHALPSPRRCHPLPHTGGGATNNNWLTYTPASTFRPPPSAPNGKPGTATASTTSTPYGADRSPPHANSPPSRPPTSSPPASHPLP